MTTMLQITSDTLDAALTRPPDTGHIERYLRHRMPDAADLEVIDLRRAFPGMSRETWFVTGRWREGDGTVASRSWVLRMDPPTGSLAPTSLRFECEVYRRLAATPLPVPPVLWYEDGPEWRIDGRDFFVREMVDGVTQPANVHDPDPAHDGVRVAVVKELMEKLAMLHALDWRELGFAGLMRVPSSPQAAAQEEIDRCLEDYRRDRLEPHPAVVEAALWMRENPPPPPQRLVLRKENNGLGEEIWDGTTIVGMCDWETASIGDPALDIAVAMTTTGKLWTLENALGHYAASGGPHVDPAAVRWYSLLWQLRTAVYLHIGLRGFGPEHDIRVQLATLGLYPHLSTNWLAQGAGF